MRVRHELSNHRHRASALPWMIALLIGLAIVLILLTVSNAGAEDHERPSGSAQSFDHFETSFDLTGAHRNVQCSDCHKQGRMTGLPRTCFGCHNGSFAEGTGQNHPSTSMTCSDCHVTTSWKPVRFDHASVTGPCASCHDGRTATGKPANHIPSSNTCDDCHVTTSWTQVRFDHAAVTGPCASCHDGRTATGKPANHIPSSNTCDDCHVTTSWTQVRVDHNSVIGTCTSCHNGRTATGKPANHIQTTAQCDLCHRTLAWTPATFDHALATGPCASCHNGRTATGKDRNHFVTTLQCDECHVTTRWTPINFRHSSANYPGDHRSKVDCIDCHTSNAQQIPWRFGAYQPDCAGCHAGDFKPDPHKKYEKPNTVRYTVGELRDCTGACHMYTDSTMTTIKKRRTREHRPNAGDF